MSYFCRVKSACGRLGGIYLVDKCLLIILAMLMLQSVFSLFLQQGNGLASDGIDAMVRTSASGIFGYLISANFNQHRKSAGGSHRRRGNTTVQVTNQHDMQIGFHAMGRGAVGDAQLSPPPTITKEEVNERNCDRAQILVVAAIGISSLLILLTFRNFVRGVEANTGSLTQFRDFVSGSVGFLISCSTSGVNRRDEK